MNPHQESIRRNLREVEDLLRDLPEDWQEPASEAIIDIERVRNSVRHMADTIHSLGEELGRARRELAAWHQNLDEPQEVDLSDLEAKIASARAQGRDFAKFSARDLWRMASDKRGREEE